MPRPLERAGCSPGPRPRDDCPLHDAHRAVPLALPVPRIERWWSSRPWPGAACPEVGATYVARPTVLAHPDPRSPPPAYRYRLRIGLLPRGALGSAISELWRFQTVALRGGTLVSELRILRVCGVGRSPCLVAPPSRPNPDDGYASEEVALDRDLSVDVRDGAPYAIVLPGLAQADWSPDLVREVLAADLRFFTPAHVPPDLGLQELWVRTRCGR